MSILDKVNAETRNIFNLFFDKEPLNYFEAAGLYGIISQGRNNIALLEVMYNHAQDPDLKNLILAAIDDQTLPVVEEAENLLQKGGVALPELSFSHRELHNEALDIPRDVRISDKEIALSLSNMGRASQLVLLSTLHQSYQLNIALVYREQLDSALDWSYRLLELMLERGWLPHMTKVEH
ncbi:Hypothetical protein LUCI_0683 [Lucifera butyrica]|uniref:DUF3231 family protein n=1 Tax=Lucifera butyrica TaxID=1351585 RepID=A0A498R5K3_9FIRM|nr:DUF3231 family protein [Lucifera butyrica]VBB05473.1 Hypothetical protein LUCI_0683 [Lucifera butyrica]